MNEIEAVILGIIQGLTEFLPVSSSGHLEIGKYLFGIETTENLLFSVVVHAATALSTIVIFRKKIQSIIVDLFKFQWNDSTIFSTKIILSMIPVGIVGLLFKDTLEGFFNGNILLVGCMLIITGLLLIFTHYKKTTDKEVSFLSSVIIGISQAVAVLPGISRSGATISTALILGVKKEKAAEFSFLMVLPPIIAATLLELKDYLEISETSSVSISPFVLAIGFFAAFISGLFACNWMIALVKKSKLIYFAIYCFIVGIIAIVAQIL